MLFDFYGDLLTDKQREYYDLYHNEDLSLSEIAENVGITRQGVQDIISRAENTLMETEKKIGIIKRFTEVQGQITKAVNLAEKIREHASGNDAAAMAVQLVNILTELKG